VYLLDYGWKESLGDTVRQNLPKMMDLVPSRSVHSAEDALLLIPLRKLCTSAEHVVELVRKVFADIKRGKRLRDFAVAKRMRGGVGRHIVDAVILQPNFAGVGVDVRKLFGAKR
jgi:hypothetical protein